MNSLEPSPIELKALKLFVSRDKTRSHLAHMWRYVSDGGITHMATDGHTIALRRAGTHRKAVLCDIAKLPHQAIGDDGEFFDAAFEPPPFDMVIKAGAGGELSAKYSINPAYFSRLADIERAAGNRAAGDYAPPPGTTLKAAKAARIKLKEGMFTSIVIPSDPLDGWYWSLETDAAMWEGVIMPRSL